MRQIDMGIQTNIEDALGICLCHSAVIVPLYLALSALGQLLYKQQTDDCPAYAHAVGSAKVNCC